MMIALRRATANDTDFRLLVGLLDADLWKRYPQTQQKYDGHNVMDPDTKAVIAYNEGMPVGCGCFRELDGGRVEIKRMFVLEPMRGKGIAKGILAELEDWAAELGFARAILDTGINQPEAFALYKKAGYRRMENYGIFAGNREIICMEKSLLKS